MSSLQENLKPSTLVDPHDQRAKPAILMCPATNCEKLTRNTQDAFMLADLEDSVPIPQKAEAAQRTSQLLSDRPEETIIIRPNATHTTGRNFFQDINALAASIRTRTGQTLILIPKVESAEDIERVEDIVSQTIGNIKLIITIETAKGISRVDEILAKSILKFALVVGWEDLTTNLKIRKPPNIFDNHVLEHIALNMLLKAKGIDIHFLDGVNDSFEGPEVREQTRTMKEIGASGKFAIHPKQIPIINETFTPTTKDIDTALRYLENVPAEFLLDGGVQKGDDNMKEGVIAQRHARVLMEALAFRHRLSEKIKKCLRRFKGLEQLEALS